MTPGRVLIVDDDPGHAHSLAGILKSAGHRVETAPDGAAAVAMLPGRPDIELLLLDLNMPEVDGYDVLEAAGAMKVPPCIIVISGERSEDMMRRLLRLGAFDYLRKPYRPEDLLHSIASALSHQRSEADAREVLARVHESDRLHRFLVDQSPDVIYLLNADGCFTFVSASSEKVFGRERKRLEGQHWTVLFGPDETRRGRFRFDERRTAHRATACFEMQLHAGDDCVSRWIEVSARGRYAADDPGRFMGTYGIARDVSDGRRIASALARSERKFATLFQSSPDALFISRGEDGRIIERNGHYDTLVAGFDNTDSDHWLFDDDGSRRRFIRSLQERGGVQRQELICRARDDTEHTLELSVRLLSAEEGTSLVAILRDVTIDREREQERLRLEGQLQQTRRLEAIGQLSGGIAHDFNNILASMIGYAELSQLTLEGTDAGERCNDYLSEVISAGQRARDLIAQLLNFSRTEEGNRKPLSVGEEMEGMLRMMRSLIPATIAIHSRIPADLPRISADPVQLQQVVVNLFINAREAIDGDGRIDLEVTRVNLTEDARCAACHAALDGSWLEISIGDDGRGIPEDVREQLFDRLITTRVAGRGAGFGLAMINSVMHQHGGHVKVESTTGEGSCFKLYFPLAEEAAVEVDVADDPGDEQAREGAHVVVVDDEVSVANFMSELLDHAGYRTSVFNDPGAALEYLRSTDSVDLVITDQTMPHMSGSELAVAIEALPGSVPVILCTGYGSINPEDGGQGSRNIVACLAKPFRLRELLDAVQQVLGRTGAA
ncbi:MAG: response regulator [Gammaproteobacteria bacterium]|nr:response regulator [Gammaproteobacteria bacterium]